MAVGSVRMVRLPLPRTSPPSSYAWSRPSPASSLGTAENVDYPGAILLKSCTETSRKAFIPFDNMRARAEMHFARFAATAHGTGVARCTDASFVRKSSGTTEGDAVYVNADRAIYVRNEQQAFTRLDRVVDRNKEYLAWLLLWVQFEIEDCRVELPPDAASVETLPPPTLSSPVEEDEEEWIFPRRHRQSSRPTTAAAPAPGQLPVASPRLPPASPSAPAEERPPLASSSSPPASSAAAATATAEEECADETKAEMYRRKKKEWSTTATAQEKAEWIARRKADFFEAKKAECMEAFQLGNEQFNRAVHSAGATCAIVTDSHSILRTYLVTMALGDTFSITPERKEEFVRALKVSKAVFEKEVREAGATYASTYDSHSGEPAYRVTMFTGEILTIPQAEKAAHAPPTSPSAPASGQPPLSSSGSSRTSTTLTSDSSETYLSVGAR